MAAALLGGVPALRVLAQSLAYTWSGYGHDPQHTAISPVASQSISRIRWSTPVDLNPQFSGNDLLIHYGSPLITQANTVLVPVKVGATDGFRVDARRASDGALIWSQASAYILPPHNWVPSYSPALTPRNKLYMPDIGGTVTVRSNADSASATLATLVFYGAANYAVDPATYNANIRICTPLTSDRYGNIYFGYTVTGDTPLHLQAGFARLSLTGAGSYVYAVNAVGANPVGSDTHIAFNCAPALSNDQKYVYVAVAGSAGSYLVKMDAVTLATIAVMPLRDVAHPDQVALVDDDGTASPTVGSDGDVYYGVLETPFGSNHARGWLLHFDANLTQTKTPGAFGWDDTASVVPASMVGAYHGTSPYLVLTKYNNYVEGGGDGVNKMAVLDPNDTQTDPVTGATVMREILTVAGPTPDADFLPDHPLAVREWCINTAAIDPATHSALVNNEDGTLYRWNLDTGALTESLPLAGALGEAYTPTLIGNDGTVYAINNATLFATGQ